MTSPLLRDPQPCRMVYLSDKPPADAPEMLAGYPDLLTVQHIGEITGLSAQTIRAEMAARRLPSCKIGRRLFCPKASFVEHVSKGGFR